MLTQRNITGDRAAPADAPETQGDQPTVHPVSPWLTVPEAAQRARVGPKTIYREVHSARLRAARVGGRRELRFLTGWIDEWLVAAATAVDWAT